MNFIVKCYQIIKPIWRKRCL